MEFEVCINTGLGANKRPKVNSIKEAAARTAETGFDLGAESGGDMDISEWLNDDSVVDADTRELSPSETMALQLDTVSDNPSPEPSEPEAPPMSGKQKPPEKRAPGKLPTPAPTQTEGSDAAAAEMLKKMRRLR